jgi:hypothetical protein
MSKPDDPMSSKKHQGGTVEKGATTPKLDRIPRSADLLVDMILCNPGILKGAHPEAELRKLAKNVTQYLPPPPMQDRWIYRIVVGALGNVAVLAVAGAIFSTAIVPIIDSEVKTAVPEILTTLGATAIGAMAGLLAPSPGARSSVDR